MNESTEQLRQLIEKHTVCYEVYPDTVIVSGQQRKVGFELELFGTHDHGSSTLTPGCPVCVNTFSDLRRIAEWIIPKERRDSQYEVLPFDRALHETASRKLAPEVALSIMIEHRHNFFEPTNDCEKRCLLEMEQKLRELGVRRGRYVAPGSKPFG